MEDRSSWSSRQPLHAHVHDHFKRVNCEIGSIRDQFEFKFVEKQGGAFFLSTLLSFCPLNRLDSWLGFLNPSQTQIMVKFTLESYIWLKAPSGALYVPLEKGCKTSVTESKPLLNGPGAGGTLLTSQVPQPTCFCFLEQVRRGEPDYLLTDGFHYRCFATLLLEILQATSLIFTQSNVTVPSC